MKLTLGEISVLFDELNGRIINQDTRERNKTGLLSQKLSIKSKYILNNQLNKSLTEELKCFDEAQLELFKEFAADGKAEENNNVYKVHSENQSELMDKINELSFIEKEIAVPDLNVEDFFDIETEDYYPIFLEKLLKKEKVASVPEPSLPL
jgi:hypothetical protein